MKQKLFLLIGILVFFLLSARSVLPPDPERSFSFHRFSKENLETHLKFVSEAPHNVGSEHHEQVRDYIFSRLKTLGYAPELQSGFGMRRIHGIVSIAKSENIIALKKSEASKSMIAIVTHYDSGENSPGAADASGSVAILLELARIFQSLDTKHSILFLFTDSEEKGILGSELFIRSHPLANEIQYVINLEARGNSGPNLLFETSEGNSELIRIAKSHISNLVTASIFYEVYKRLPNDTDFTLFKQKKIKGYNFAYINDLIHYHSTTDQYENLSRESLYHQAGNSLELLEILANSEFEESSESEDSIFFTLPVFGTFSFSLIFQYIFIFLSLPLLFRLIQNPDFSMRELFRETFFYLNLCIVILGSVYFSQKFIFQINPDFPHKLSPLLYKPNSYYIFTFFWVAGLFLGFYGFSKSALRRYEKIASPLPILLLLFIGLLTLSPTAGYIIWIPLFFYLLGEVRAILYKKEETEKRFRSRMIFFVPTILILFPDIILLYQTFNLSFLAAPALFEIILLSFSLPFLSEFQEKEIRYASLFCLLVSLFFYSKGFSENYLSSSQPSHSHIQYIENFDTGKAHFFSIASNLSEYERTKLGETYPELGRIPGETCTCIRSNYFDNKGNSPGLQILNKKQIDSKKKLNIELTKTNGGTGWEIRIEKKSNLKSIRVGDTTLDIPDEPIYSQNSQSFPILLFPGTQPSLTLELEFHTEEPISILVMERKKGVENLSDLPETLVPAPASFQYYPFHTYYMKNFHLE